MKRFTLGDGLRGVAAIGVVALHTHLPLPFAMINAYWPDFFFVLSGLVLAKYFDPSKTKPSFKLFAAKRIVRFYPLVFCAVLTMLAFTYAQLHLGTAAEWPDRLSLPRVLAALALLQILSVSVTWVMVPLWSLSAELLINLTAYWPVRRFGTPLLIALPILGFIVELIRIPQYSSLPDHIWQPITGVMSLARVSIGFSLGLLIARYPAGGVRPIWLAASLVVFGIFVVSPNPDAHQLAAPFVYALLLRELVPLEPRFAATRMSKFAGFLGTSSFGIYVWHPAFLAVTYAIGARFAHYLPIPREVTNFVIVLSLTLIATRITYRWVERPTMRWINSRTKIAAVAE